MSPKGRLLLKGEDLKDVFFTCLTCARCEIFCPSGFEIVDEVEKERTRLRTERVLPEKLIDITQKVLKTGNPYGCESVRFEAEKCEYLYYPGCSTIYRAGEVFESVLNILDYVEIDYSVEYNYCCGSTLLRTGESGEAARRNFESLRDAVERTGAKYIITSCPGCYRTIKKDYARLFGGLGVEVVHIVELLDQKLSGNSKLDIKVTYHDSCHLGRHMGVYDAPRKVLSKMATLVEMESNRERSLCCGGGGGVRAAYPELYQLVREKRIDEAVESGADILVTSCPFCYMNLKKSGRVEVLDLTMLIEKVLMAKPSTGDRN
jgi:Fe-S oxidoreductase